MTTPIQIQPSPEHLDLGILNPYLKWAFTEPETKPAICQPELWDHIDDLPQNLTGMIKIGNIYKPLGIGCRACVVSGELSFKGTIHKVAVKQYSTARFKPISRDIYSKAIARELKVMRWLRHPNILHFHGICIDNSTLDFHGSVDLFIVSSHCDGGEVSNYLRKHPQTRRMPLNLGIIDGISYLHEHKIVHGEIKPANILIESNGDSIRPVVCGFGSSRVIGDDNSFVWEDGSYRYIAPEIANSDTPAYVTKASDIYALGLTMLLVISGKEALYHLFDTSHLFAIAKHLWDGNRPLFADHNAIEMTDAAWVLLENCWKQEPMERLSINQVGAQVRALIASSSQPASLAF